MSTESSSSKRQFASLGYAFWVTLLVLLVLPFVAQLLGLEYYVGFVRRLLIVVIAALGLDFILGVGGMPSLGQAAFMGVGAYTAVGLIELAGVMSFWILGGAAILSSTLAASLIGVISLRTRGTYFIMITLAFAQMLYYFAVSLRSFGGDDGYTLAVAPHFGFGQSQANLVLWYFVVLGCAVLAYVGLRKLSLAPLGRALAGIRDNETRMTAMGCPVFLVKFTAFTLAGALAGLSGFLLLMDNRFFSPTTMHWTQSAMLLVMVVLGGKGRLWGAVLGVVLWLGTEEFVRQQTLYWHWPLGIALILIVLFVPGGLAQLFQRKTVA
uniref:Branched chain amino acid ABC transporter permease n=1 Tax=Comamonas testosteroni TaxID=285 RepID=G9C9E6_COMTE|nr:branched-chain amino acid ABC transporter permease [Comamonas testosteroni]AEX00411.1 branched chain amino acid ABC transporter permease [Comamonas testosteroni]